MSAGIDDDRDPGPAPFGDPIAMEAWFRACGRHGIDPHRRVAAAMYHCAYEDVTLAQRQRAKSALFMYLYRAEPPHVAAPFPVPAPNRYQGYAYWSRDLWTAGQYYERMLQDERLRYEPRHRRIAAHLWEARGYRRWGRWDDVLYWWDLDEIAFYRRFGVTKETAQEAIYWVLSDVARLKEIFSETSEEEKPW